MKQRSRRYLIEMKNRKKRLIIAKNIIMDMYKTAIGGLHKIHPLPKYPLGAPSTRPAVVAEHGAEFIIGKRGKYIVPPIVNLNTTPNPPRIIEDMMPDLYHIGNALHRPQVTE